MKNSVKKLGLALGAMTIFASSLAAAASWTAPLKITSIEVDPVGNVGTATWLAFSTTPTGKPACGKAGQVELTGPADQVKAMTALATAAFLAGKTVTLYWDGGCDGTYAKVSLLTMQ